jgi:hypothetical protein
MKKILLAAFLLTSIPAVNYAQGTSQAVIEQKANAETDKWVAALGLTTAQKVQLHTVNLNVEKQKDRIQQAGTSASPERTTAVNKYKKDKYQSILTADQFAQYEALVAQGQ